MITPGEGILQERRKRAAGTGAPRSCGVLARAAGDGNALARRPQLLMRLWEHQTPAAPMFLVNGGAGSGDDLHWGKFCDALVGENVFCLQVDCFSFAPVSDVMPQVDCIQYEYGEYVLAGCVRPAGRRVLDANGDGQCCHMGAAGRRGTGSRPQSCFDTRLSSLLKRISWWRCCLNWHEVCTTASHCWLAV
jgi:hypothetical protein